MSSRVLYLSSSGTMESLVSSRQLTPVNRVVGRIIVDFDELSGIQFSLALSDTQASGLFASNPAFLLAFQSTQSSTTPFFTEALSSLQVRELLWVCHDLLPLFGSCPTMVLVG